MLASSQSPIFQSPKYDIQRATTYCAFKMTAIYLCVYSYNSRNYYIFIIYRSMLSKHSFLRELTVSLTTSKFFKGYILHTILSVPKVVMKLDVQKSNYFHELSNNLTLLLHRLTNLYKDSITLF